MIRVLADSRPGRHERVPVERDLHAVGIRRGGFGRIVYQAHRVVGAADAHNCVRASCMLSRSHTHHTAHAERGTLRL